MAKLKKKRGQNWLLSLLGFFFAVLVGLMLGYRTGLLDRMFGGGKQVDSAVVYSNPYIVVGYRFVPKKNLEVVLGKALDSNGSGLKTLEVNYNNADMYRAAINRPSKYVAFTTDDNAFGVYDIKQDKFIFTSLKDNEDFVKLKDINNLWIRDLSWLDENTLLVKVSQFLSDNNTRTYKYDVEDIPELVVKPDGLDFTQEQVVADNFSDPLPNDLYTLVNKLGLNNRKIIYQFSREDH